MVINLKAICDKTDMTQTEFAKLTGISRYTVWKATEPAYDGMFNVTSDRFYQIHKSIPDLLPLPDDFFHYTRPGFMINKYLNQYSKEETLSEVPKRLYDSNDYFLYSYKEQIDRLFPKICLPYYIDQDNELKLYMGTDYIPFNPKQYDNQHITLRTPITWEHCQEEFYADKEMFDKYSTDNIRANLLYRHLALKDFLGMLTTDLRMFMKKEVSFVQNGSLLEQVFNPYIIMCPYQT